MRKEYTAIFDTTAKAEMHLEVKDILERASPRQKSTLHKSRPATACETGAQSDEWMVDRHQKAHLQQDNHNYHGKLTSGITSTIKL